MVEKAPVTEREITVPSTALPLPPRELDFCKCGKGKCPKVKLLESGGFEVLDEEISASPIRFDAEDASRLRSWLQEHGF